MATTVDARGLACPQPVIMVKQALEAGATELEVMVDNEAAVENVSRLASRWGVSVEVAGEAPDFILTLTGQAKTVGPSEGARLAEAAEEAVLPPGRRPRIIYIGSDVIGQGSEELGMLLRRTFLKTLTEGCRLPEKIIFMNSGVKLVAEGSKVIDELKALSDLGVELSACGTCLDYFNLKDKLAVGRIGNMYEFAEDFVSEADVVSV